MLESGKATDALCNYDGPQGKRSYSHCLPECCARSWAGIRTTEYCTNKRQPERVFLLIYLFAGRRADGRVKKVLFPLARNTLATLTPDWKKICLSLRVEY